MHELDIGNFYFGPTRRAYKAAAGRYEDIIKNYPYFTYRDEALFKAGVALIEQEQPEEASQYFTDLVRNIPHSEYVKDAKAYLEKLGKPIPEPANDNPAPPAPWSSCCSGHSVSAIKAPRKPLFGWRALVSVAEFWHGELGQHCCPI
jgi:tetratricopeptide (TPR) repeat protein